MTTLGTELLSDVPAVVATAAVHAARECETLTLTACQRIEVYAKLHPEVPLEKVEAITRSLVNKLFHGPSERLRKIDDPDPAYRFAALFQPGVTNNIHQEPPR